MVRCINRPADIDLPDEFEVPPGRTTICVAVPQYVPLADFLSEEFDTSTVAFKIGTVPIRRGVADFAEMSVR